MIWRFLRMLFHLKPKQKLDIIPRAYAPEYDRTSIDRESERVMAYTQARSPRNVQLLMQKHGVTTADELLAILPPRRRVVNPRQRLKAWWMRLEGRLPYDPEIPGAIRRMDEAGRLYEDSLLIYRTKVPEDQIQPKRGGE